MTSESQSTELLVQQQLDLSYQHLPIKSMELTHGRYTLDNLLSHADYQLLAWPNLEHGLHAWARLFTLLTSGIVISIRHHGSGLAVRFESEQPLPLWLLHLIRALDLRLSEFNQEESENWQWEFVQRECWQEASKLGLTHCSRGKMNQLLVPYALKQAEYGGQLPKVPQLLDYYRQQLLKDPGPSLSLVEQCKQTLTKALPQVLQLEQLAGELGMSGRNLQRQLKLSGVSYSALLSEVRQIQARARLADTDISVRRLATELGFSEPSNFIRAFRQLEGCSPSDYRKLVKQHQISPEHLPIRFLYAENLLQTEWRNNRRGARVWMEVRNIAFTKSVEVLCEDLDGVWRGYPANFERWLGPGRELWVSGNIAVFDPLRFRLQFRADNRLYVDDNNGHGYGLTAKERYLLGEQAIAPLSLEQFELPDGQRMLTGRVLTHSYGEDQLRGIASDHAWLAPQEFEAKISNHNQRGVICWQFAATLPPGKQLWLRFEHHSEEGRLIDDNGGEGYRPRDF
ncbi:helix-turn-helix transcriptional regulator [Corallincola platygyrae]|uniref:Helix-turn-helix transcriptional regulator n=1 Tax=Corallincola platygyrae TaxID=1193278 RepID=A0ABW4XNS3_9GAMM